MKKQKEIKIRREWVRHPATRIKKDKDKKDYCQICGLYKTEPEKCFMCEKDVEAEDYFNGIGSA
jgi:hypothetical protein